MLVTLLTDFGIADYFVGAMKGAILSVSPGAQIVDITHLIPPQDIEAGAFTLLAVYRDFPADTIHVAVVDPGVGSSRRPLLVTGGGQFFIGPDNGIFGYVYEREAGARVYHLDREEFFHPSVSPTFHGRDVFAPVAGALSNGVEPAALGREVSDYVRLSPLAARRSADAASLDGAIIHIDRFGNCVTNLAREPLTEEMIDGGARLILGEHEINSFRRFYAEAGATPGELFAIWGSAGLLEIAALNSSAARLLNAVRGQPVRLVRNPGRADAQEG
ncbi:MAG TPA: SAM-dependent chlorinase/fluorinase [Pyrinomonadaceae bacterium]|jgi:S-adenosylmethionine hydrolase|nr:SAM-dependent chlorinase/fluorinase [Pyrinomonadaceae bacterium]